MFNKKEYLKQYRLVHKEEIRIKKNLYMKKYAKLHRKEIKERDRLYRLTHKKEINKYKQDHKIESKEYNKRYTDNRLKIDINFKLAHYLRSRTYRALIGNPKLKTTMNLVGCSIDQLKQHLESQFTKGMSFKNYGKWHIDHIKPCASFDLSKASEQRKCFNYTNLQPLWAVENLRKGDR